MITKVIPKPFNLLPDFRCPAEFWLALGYEGTARYVTIYWEHTADEANYYDGRSGLCGANWQAYLLLLNDNLEYGHPAREQLGNSDWEATHWLVIDREKELVWLAPRLDAEKFLRAQWLETESGPAVTVASVDQVIDRMIVSMKAYVPPTPGEILQGMELDRQRLTALKTALNERLANAH